METISRNLEELLAFHTVAMEGSFTRAAEVLGTSKAMLSKKVKRLETYTQALLFHRTTRTLALTENGIALFNYSKKILELSNEASRRLKDVNQGSSGLLRISAPVSLGELIFPPLVQEMKKHLPQVKIELDLSNENRDFEKDNVDFALRATEVHHPDLIVRPLGRIKDVICVSPKFLEREKIQEDLAKLSQYKCILHSQEEIWNRWTFSSSEGDTLVEVKGEVSTNQYPLARLLCLQGLGILRIPLYMVDEDLKRNDLIELFSFFKISTHPLHLVYLRNEYETTKHRTAKELILKWIKENKRFFI